MKLPQCIKGKRACPPEDVGGPWGYEGFLEAINDPHNDEHDSYLEWIGGEFDPEAFELEPVNQQLQQKAERNWSGNTPSPSEDGQTAQNSIFDPARWTNLLTAEGFKTAEELALRKDMVTFLTYLKDNKVTGTQSIGNLPRKVIEAIAPQFVKPPALETKIGDTVFRFQNEDNVWSIFFVHVLAQGADLISGGPGRRWRLSDAGDEFLSAPAMIQVCVLFAAWWYRVNWLIAYADDIFGDELPIRFSKTVETQLRALPVDEPQLCEPFADRVIQAMGWTWPEQESDNTRSILTAAIQYMVIDPLEHFGILSTQREKNNRRLIDTSLLVSFTLTKFGLAMLESMSIEE